MLIILISILTIGVGVLYFTTNEPKSENEKKENVSEGVKTDKEGKLISWEFNGNTYTEKKKLELTEPKNKELIAKSAELKKIKDEYKIEYTIYETVEKTKLGEMKNFLIIFKNNGNKDYKEKLKFPCEYFLTIHENEDFLSGKKDCKVEKEIELFIKTNEDFYFMLGKMFQGGEKEKTIYIETPFDIKEAKIKVE
jgi:hypothetical protein